MRRKILLSTVLASVLASSAYATNGDHLIGIGGESRAMGGTGTATVMGAETAYNNAALLTKVDGTQMNVGLTYFMPSVSAEQTMNNTEVESAAPASPIPQIAVTHKYSDALSTGLAIYGSAGMGVDYNDESPAGQDMKLFGMVTSVQMMKIVPTLAYAMDAFSVGISPVIQMAQMGIKYDSYSPVDGSPFTFDETSDWSMAYGFEFGLAYDATKELTVGLTYKSAIATEYTDVFKPAMANFGITSTDTLEQPAEIALGLGYAADAFQVALDVKQIQWSAAEGYDIMGWEDQTVIALGGSYDATKELTVRAGFNNGATPLKDQGATGVAFNTLNYIGFPATVENHITLGAGYALGSNNSVDLAYVNAMEAKTEVPGYNIGTVTTTHSQNSITLAYNHSF